MSELLAARIAGEIPDTLLLCEHEPVFTLGRRRGAEANVLAAGDVPVIIVERGGDVTWHGPGQLVGYPIVALPDHRHDLHAYLRLLEQVIIDVLGDLGVAAGRDSRNTGVWVEGRKIAAIGISARRWVAWHGFALNLTTDLSYYQRINPCGMSSDLTTRLIDHLDPCPGLDDMGTRIAARFAAAWTDWRAPPAIV